MTGTGSFGTATAPLSKLFTERVVLTERISDPSNPAKGAVWFRSDLDSGTDKFGEVRWYDGASINSVPVFDKGTSGSNVEEVLGIKTKNGVGYLPTASRTDAAFPQLTVRHGGSDLGLHDSKQTATVLDDFEDGDIAEYGGDTGYFSTQTGTVYNGSVALESSAAGNVRIIVDSGIAQSQGATMSMFVQNQCGLVFFAQSEAGASSVSCYYAELDPAGKVNCYRIDNGSITILFNFTVSVASNTWYEIQVQTDGVDGITVELLDSSGSSLGSKSTTDGTYTSGGLGVFAYDNAPKADYIRKL